MTTEVERLQQAIAALEAQRAVLGAAVVEIALLPLREQLAALQSQATSAVPGEESQQRKIVTVLFADIPGLAALSENVGIEETREAANALWEKLDAVILQHGGRIDKHMGNGVMALWGAEVVSEDDPQQSIRAALAMRQALDNFVHTSPLFENEFISDDGLELRVGINTGPALVGLVGAMREFTAIGDAVNLAARLNQISSLGNIRISSETYERVHDEFDVDTQSPVFVKGKTEPVQTYLVRRARPLVFRIQSRGVEGIETPLVGRAIELDSLKQTFGKLFIAPLAAQFITVIGEMGIGKSRLIYELITWADTRPNNFWVFQGRAFPSQMSAPYVLLRDMFAFRFDIQDNDPLAIVHEKMERGFAQFMPEDNNAKEKAHIIGQLLGYDFSASPYLRGLKQDPKQIRSLAFSYLVRFFSAACKIWPAMLMLEDIHWADSGSLDAIMHLQAHIAPETPLFMLTTARPALFEHYPNWSARTQRIDLKALTREESRGLVDQILKKVKFLPGALRELVVGGAEGNPFYLEELIKMLIDGRAIQPGEPDWKVDLERLGTVNIPSTLAGVLQARIDGLDITERTSLQRASIIGRIFWDSAVEALSPELHTERERLYDTLNVLRAKEFVYTNPTSTFSGTQEFTFKHALMRDVTYETVLKRQRVQYHALVADWLSKVSGERRGEFLPIIADHYEKAGDINKATDTLMEAGEQALKVSGFNEAFHFFQRAAQLVPATRPRDHAYIQLKLGETFQRTGEYGDALKYSLRALELSRNFTIGNLYAATLYQLGQIYAEMGDYAKSEPYFTQAMPIARAGTRLTRETLAKVLYGLGNISWRLGKLEEARRYCEESYQIATEVHDTNTLLLALNRLAVVKGLLGDPDGEERGYEHVLDLAVAIGNRERAAVALNNLGALADERGELAKAQGYYLKAIAMAREIGAQQSLALYLINLAHSEIKLRSLDDGKQHLQEGLALARHLGAGPWMLTAVMFFARLEAAHGNYDKALQLLGMAEHHPAYSPDHQRLTEQMLQEWRLDEKLIAERLAVGAAFDWDQTVLSLLV